MHAANRTTPEAGEHRGRAPGRLRLLLVLVSLALGVAPASASWPLEGIALSDAVYGAGMAAPQLAHLLPAPSGGVYAAAGNGGGNGQHWYVQRILPPGGLAPAWPTAALSSGGAFSSNGVGTQGFTVDAAGTWWHAWNDGGLFLQAVQSDASRVPLPAGSSWAVGYAPHNPINPRLASDGAGGIYLASYGNSTAQIRLQHLLADGSTAPGWSPRGRRIGEAFSLEFCHLLPDGSGGAVVVWPDLSAAGARMRALRVNADTTIAAGWPAAGLLLGSGGIGPVFSNHPPYDLLLPSGPDHFIVGWADATNSTAVHVYLQRFGLDGTLDPAWPASGLDVLTPGTLAKVTLVADGLAGVHVLWEAGGVPLTTHVLASGQFAPGHDAQGVPLVDAAAGYRTSSYWGFYAGDRLSGATGPDGGLLFAWSDFRQPQPTARVRWILANGLPDPAEDAAGRIVSPPGIGNVIGLLPDGAGGGYVAWWVNLSGETFVGLENRIARAERSTNVGVPPRAGSSALALRAPMPNPARGSVRFDLWLADDAPARFTLFDLAGRVHRSTTLTGAGPHSIRFEDLGTLAPGLYHAQLVQGRDRREQRVVIVR